MSVVACSRCGDFRSVINARHQAAPCPDCGIRRFPAEADYVAFRKLAVRNHAPRPEITEADLSDKEYKEFKVLEKEHPDASHLTILSWMEGRRYDPRSDPYFLEMVKEQAAARFAERVEELRGGQPEPEWLTRALTGKAVDLEPVEGGPSWQRPILEELRKNRQPPSPRRREDGYVREPGEDG